MKAIYFFLSCLFLSITFNQLSAQNNQENDFNRSVVTKGSVNPYTYYVFCDGVPVDELMCTPPFQNVVHYQKGVQVWCISRNFGQAISVESGEVFTFKDIDRITITDFQNLQGFVTDHVNLIGNAGSHYIAFCIYKFPSWEIISVVKSNCPGVKK